MLPLADDQLRDLRRWAVEQALTQPWPGMKAQVPGGGRTFDILAMAAEFERYVIRGGNQE